MPYKFNPFVGNLQYYESATAGGITYYKTYKIVDAAFLLNKEITLDINPAFNSEFIFVNGLILEDNNYTITGTTLTFEPTLPFKLGYKIDVRYTA